MNGNDVEIREERNLIIITDDIIEKIITEMQATRAQTIFVDGTELISERYLNYFLTIINGNRDKGGIFEFAEYGKPSLRKIDIFKIVGNQLKSMTIKRKKCFDDVRLIVDSGGAIKYRIDRHVNHNL